MFWKQWPGWLKGGIISDIIILVITVPVILCGTSCVGEECMGCIIFGPHLLLVGFLVDMIELIIRTNINNVVFYTLVGLSFYFAVGAFIGYIVSRARKRKNLG